MFRNLAYALAKNGASRPDVKYYCDISYDPFLLLQRENKVYGKVFHYNYKVFGLKFNIHLQASQYRSMSINPPSLLYGLQWKVRVTAEVNPSSTI